jgi:ATP-dependent Clp protease protease subunit
MNLYKKKLTRFEGAEETEKSLPENPMEKMMGGMMFDKKFIEQRKIFLWGAVDDKSAKDITTGSYILSNGAWKRNYFLHK